MTAADYNALRAHVAARFAQQSDDRLPIAAREALVEYGGTLIGPDDHDGPAEYQLELLGVLGFGATITGAARQWTGNVRRIFDPAGALADSHERTYHD